MTMRRCSRGNCNGENELMICRWDSIQTHIEDGTSPLSSEEMLRVEMGYGWVADRESSQWIKIHNFG